VILLDTHVLIWWARRDFSRLTTPARDAIEAEMPVGRILVSSITAWETALLASLNRVTFAVSVQDWFADLSRISAVEFVPVDNEIGIEAVLLPDDFHRDPADRIIVATAREWDYQVVTRDRRILDYASSGHCRALAC